MSTTTIYVFGSNGYIKEAEEYPNGHTATVLWDILWKRYLARRSPDGTSFHGGVYYGEDGMEGFPLFGFDSKSESRIKEFWKLFEDPRMAWFERAALGSTYDHMIVIRENLMRLAEAFDLFTETHIPADNRMVWHVPAWARLLRELAKDPTVFAIGWQHTSCGDNPFADTYCDGEGNELETPIEYCLFKDPKVWQMCFDHTGAPVGLSLDDEKEVV